jgi:hypothetical protein
MGILWELMIYPCFSSFLARFWVLGESQIHLIGEWMGWLLQDFDRFFYDTIQWISYLLFDINPSRTEDISLFFPLPGDILGFGGISNPSHRGISRTITPKVW